MGWTGDAQVFCRTAAINFDVEKFFAKWLGGVHYSDWLTMDAGEDSYVGATSNDLIAIDIYFSHF